ncbi:OsmC family protein [Pyxidicoccus fallax]|uniref:OsmC family protein n=1 Tax=Pyxidicoccus fallax TaxID=394095 RepID=A0A848LFG1_9BACT|nr:OsmC family protein [Pyxidicoccus fallax]NMO17072.1 OsmC family protein [Pyxidicoccus fallax]NPC78854.1 OsmC family protein [Pyxidicoccus fallax]
MTKQLYTGEVRTVGESMARSTTEAGAFKIFMDEPPELGGRNGAPSPLDFILAAHAGCLNYMTFFIAKELGIPVTSTEISVRGSLDPAKFAGTDRSVRAGYQSLEVTILIKSPANADQIAKLKSEVEARCPVSDNLAHPTPVHITMRTVA